MEKQNSNNKSDTIVKRSYHGSLYILFILFTLFLYKTSLCTVSASEIDLRFQKNDRIAETKDTVKNAVDSNKSSQKNKIKELTVSKKLVNINTASVDELTGLKGIGKKIAQEIVKFRNETGGFQTPEDIMKVKGIGKAKYSAIRDYIILK
ncbi:TPA: hypothetical protein DCR49_09075 [Candidatus Delongbacteria bacterium]|nr:MAG: hypothetical protein A2Y39_03975 [Candidatus Delongbacteria bacterium GWF2_40_14]HAQ62126.1 hypothetical protein [Candidatus Delongbacteria bacterium]